MSHIDFQEYITDSKPKKCILLYHWDCDGLASAALFIEYIQRESPETEIIHMTPTINNYFLTEKEFETIAEKNAEMLLTTDINFGLDVIERLETIVPQLFVFDHHAQTADIDRPGVQDPSYPGCSLLVSDYLLQPLSLLAILGMVGDQEDRIVEYTDFYPLVQEMMKEKNLSFDDVQRVTKLVDTMYMIGDTEGFRYVIELLQKDPVLFLTDERSLQNEQRIQEAMEIWTQKKCESIGKNILFLSIDSPMSLISEVTRFYAKAHPEMLIVTEQRWGDDASFYVRRRNHPIDLGVVVDLARSKGFNAGGKPEVAGVVLPSKELDSFRDEVISLLQTVT